MSNNSYQELVAQAWTTYTSTQSKYRGGEYSKLLKPLYEALMVQLDGIDKLVSALGQSTPPSDESLKNAEKQFTLLQGTIDSVTDVIGAFLDMDKKAVNKAATLDQAALKKVYAGVQAADDTLLATFASSVFNAQEAAAQAMNVFGPAPEAAAETASKSAK